MGKKRTPPHSERSRTVIVLFIALLVILVGTMILLPKERPTQPREVSPVLSPEGRPFAGQAIAGFEQQAQVDLPNLLEPAEIAARQIKINPKAATAIIDSEGNIPQKFTIEVIAHPQHPDPALVNKLELNQFNQMEISIAYDFVKLKFKAVRLPASSTFGNVAFFNRPDQPQLGPGTVTYRAENLDPARPAIISQATAVLELDFEPVDNNFGPTDIKITNAFIRPPGNEIRNAIDFDNNNPPTATITVKKKFYRDEDGDGYGATNNYQLELGAASPAGFVARKGDCNDDPQNNGVDFNPGIADGEGSEPARLCNSIDNDCDGDVNDEIVPTCNQIDPDGDAQLGVECGIHRVCQNTRFLDCNVDAGGLLLSGQTKCNPGADALAGNKICNNDNGRCEDPVVGADAECIADLAQCRIDLDAQRQLQIGAGVAADRLRERALKFRGYTPACGIDGDGNGDLCDPYEHMLNCPEDCQACPLPDCRNNDFDNDGLGQDYEIRLNGALQRQFPFDPPITFFNERNADTDGDGVADNHDYCPGTNTLGNTLTLTSGFIGPNGCYAGDIGSNTAEGVLIDLPGQPIRPDGCFEFQDYNYLPPNYRICPFRLK